MSRPHCCCLPKDQAFRELAQVTLETSAASHLFITSFLISHFCLALAGALEFYQSWTTLRNRDIILAQSTIKVCNLCPRFKIHRDSWRFPEILCNSWWFSEETFKENCEGYFRRRFRNALQLQSPCYLSIEQAFSNDLICWEGPSSCQG